MFVQNNMFILNGRKLWKHCHMINFHNFTEHIIKLTQDDTLYHHLKERQNFQTNVNLTMKFYKTHTQGFDNLNMTSNIGLL